MRYVSLFSGIEAATVAWEHLGWEPVAFAEIEPFPCAVLAYSFPDVTNLGDVTKIDWGDFIAKYGAVDIVVGGSPCQSFSIAGNRGGWTGSPDSCGSTFARYASSVLESCSGRTSRERSRAGHGGLPKETTFGASCPRWMTSGMVWHGEYWTRNSSEWPRDAAVCSLSDVLETRNLPPKYFLSPKACAGIIRRAEKRGKSLPPLLDSALRRVTRRSSGAESQGGRAL